MKRFLLIITLIALMFVPLITNPMPIYARGSCEEAAHFGGLFDYIAVNGLPIDEMENIDYSQDITLYMVVNQDLNYYIENPDDTTTLHPPFYLVFDSPLESSNEGNTETWEHIVEIQADDFQLIDGEYVVQITVPARDLIALLDGKFVPSEDNDSTTFNIAMWGNNQPYTVSGIDDFPCISPFEIEIDNIPYDTEEELPRPIVAMVPFIDGAEVGGPNVSLESGQSFSFSWSAQNVSPAEEGGSVCVASGNWEGPKSDSGDFSAGALTPPPSTYVYEIRCTNGPDNESSYALTVNVQDPETPVENPQVNLRVRVNGGEPQDGSITIEAGDTVVLEWTIANATDCDTDEDIVDSDASQWQETYFDMDTNSFNLGSLSEAAAGIYSLSCVNNPDNIASPLQASDQIVITITPPPPPENTYCPPEGRDCLCVGDVCDATYACIPDAPDYRHVCFPDRTFCDGSTGKVAFGRPPPGAECPEPPGDGDGGESTLYTPGNPFCPDGESIYTAIGCIPINNQTAFVRFIILWSIGVTGGLAFLLIVYAGFIYITSSGDPKKMQTAVSIITAVISGVILIILSAYLLRILGIDILDLPDF